MTADAQHRSPDVPPTSPSPTWSTPPTSGEPRWAAPPVTPTAPVDAPTARRGHRVTALVASGALAVGLVSGVGIGRATAPAGQSTGTTLSGFPQGGPGGAGGTGVPGGVPGQGSAAAPDQSSQSGQLGAVPGSGTAAAPSQPGSTTT